MQRYLARRLAQALLVIVGISAVAFALTHVIGDPVVLLLPFQASPAQVAVMRHALGLDQPLFVQYLTFLRASLHGDFGLFVQALHHLVLPALVLAAFNVSLLTRFTRSAVLEVIGNDFVRAARAKGLPGRIVRRADGQCHSAHLSHAGGCRNQSGSACSLPARSTQASVVFPSATVRPSRVTA